VPINPEEVVTKVLQAHAELIDALTIVIRKYDEDITDLEKRVERLEVRS
jgi:hypothetical protein